MNRVQNGDCQSSLESLANIRLSRHGQKPSAQSSTSSSNTTKYIHPIQEQTINQLLKGPFKYQIHQSEPKWKYILIES